MFLREICLIEEVTEHMHMAELQPLIAEGIQLRASEKELEEF